MQGTDKLNETLVADGLESITAACGFLKVSRTTLYGLMESGQLSFCKVGRSRRIPKRALIELAASNLFGGEAEGRGH